MTSAGSRAAWPEVPRDDGDEVLVEYRDHLIRERGLAPPTVAGYLTVARQFFAALALQVCTDLAELRARFVIEFVVEAAEHRPAGTTRHRVTALRSLLRFLHLDGHAPNLVGVVPKVAGWRGAGLPRGLDPAQFERLVASCDPASTLGRRDRVMLMLLGRLGLRVGELVALDLGDIDWRRAEVTIRGKARRDERVPLPSQVGEALADYVLHGRPGGPEGPLFLRLVDETVHRWTTEVARSALGTTCRRARVPVIGPHALRHMAATDMLRAGASLIAVGQVLRHRSVSTTAIYTKVDIEPLRSLARPWPVR